MNGRQAKKLRKLARLAGRDEALAFWVKKMKSIRFRERLYIAWKIVTNTFD